MRIRLRNFTSHDDTLITLPDRGLVVVTGPNGSGKSAMIEGVACALWGRAARGARWSGWRRDPGMVLLEDPGLIVERRWTGRGKTLRWTTGATPDHDTTSKAQEGLDEVVGPFDVWRRTCVFSSSDAAHFTLASDAERKELLEALLGLGWFERALAACRMDLRSAQTLRGQAEREREQAAAGLEAATRGLDQARALLEEVGQVPDAGLARAELARVDDHLRDIAAERRELQAALAPALQAGGEHRARASALLSRLDELGTSPHCYACGQEISPEIRTRLEEEARAELEAAKRTKLAAVDRVRELSERESDLEPEEEALRRIATRARSELSHLEHARVARARLQRAVDDSASDAARLTATRDEAAARADALSVDVAELEACERVLGVRGARATLLGRTLGAVERLANSWLLRLSSRIQVQLRPYTERKSGGTVDAISLVLVGAGGDGVGDYVGASAGERRRVDVALLMALAELATGARAGATWESPVFFDEVFDGLDGDGREAVTEVLEEISERRCVVLITHDERLAVHGRADLRLRVDAGRVT